MKTTPFLDTAETRATHLRELSHHLLSLEWTNAARREVEHEIPELELAMAVYRRLNAEGDTLEDSPGAKAFLTVAEARAEHLRQISHHMDSLEWVDASLTEVENEIPELELALTVYRHHEIHELEVAMAVYRRLAGEADEPGTQSAATSAARDPRWLREEDEAEAEPAPSFSQFAMAHLDLAEDETADADPGSNGTA